MKRNLLFLVSLLMAFSLKSQQVSLIYSTDIGKNCIIRVNTGKIHDNKFDVELQVQWVSNDMKPVKDLNSVVGFNTDKILVTPKNYVSLATNEKTISFNSTKKITFIVDEKIITDSIKLEFPFFYAVSADKANIIAEQTEFSFKRPRNYYAAVALIKADLVDKTPPTLTYILPEGVNDGLKPIVNVNSITVRVQSSDYFGIKSVIINNIPATQIDDSLYETDVPLRAGYENKVVAIVTDISGHTAQREFSVECRKADNRQNFMATNMQQQNYNQNIEIKPAIISDVDTAIPVTGYVNEMRFALIIGNEDYTSYQTGLKAEMNVEFALRDAEMFAEYAKKVLGVPEMNIILVKNGKVLEMHKAINKLNSIIKNTKGQGEFFVFYAGHGFPDEITKEPYIIPVDVSGSDLAFAIKLTDFYKKLSEFPSKRVTVFIDACFSGGGRDMGLLAARGVTIKPKENLVNGNIIVFSASSGEQSSLPYKEKGHGIFTYYLLKKLHESQGNLSYHELSEYINSTVSIRSVIINNKEQNPQTNISSDVVGTWKSWKFIE